MVRGLVDQGRVCQNTWVRMREVLKLFGAGLAGAVVAGRIVGGRKRSREYSLVLEAVSREIRHQFHAVVLQAVVPGIPGDAGARWTEVLAGEADFMEQIRFFREVVPDFTDRVRQAVCRLGRLHLEGSLAPVSRRRMAPDLAMYREAVEDVLTDLREALGPPESGPGLSGSRAAEPMPGTSAVVAQGVGGILTAEAVVAALERVERYLSRSEMRETSPSWDRGG